MILKNNNIEVIKMKDFLVGISPSSDGDLLHLSEGSTDFLGITFMDMFLNKDEEENENDGN